MKKDILSLIAFAALSFVPLVGFAEVPDPPSDHQEPVEDYVSYSGRSVVPSTLTGDASGFVIGTVTPTSIEGQMLYERGARRFQYVDSEVSYTGYLAAEEVASVRQDFAAANQERKATGSCIGAYTALCPLIVPIIEAVINSFQGGEDDALDVLAEQCVSLKKMAIQEVSRQSAQCLAAGGSPSTDMGGKCGEGAKVDCTIVRDSAGTN